LRGLRHLGENIKHHVFHDAILCLYLPDDKVPHHVAVFIKADRVADQAFDLCFMQIM
jgi:hypothetical protein